MNAVVDLDQELFAAEADGFIILQDLLLTMNGSKIDRLVIGPTGVFVISPRPWVTLPSPSDLEADVLAQIQLSSLVFKRLIDCLIAYAASVRPIIATHAVSSRFEVLGVGIVPPSLLSRTILNDDQEMDSYEIEHVSRVAQQRFLTTN